MGRRGWLDVGERSILKSPRSMRDLSLEGDNYSDVDSTSDSREAEEVARWLDKRGRHKVSLKLVPRVYSCGTQTLDLRNQRSRPC